VVSRANIPVDFPHSCSTSRTWIRSSDTQFKIICSFCKKPYGFWNFTPAIEQAKVYPEDINAKFSTEQKKKMT
jgi:hypothetical protein